MKYGKSKLLSILRLPLTRQMLRDLVDSLWRDPLAGASAESGLGMDFATGDPVDLGLPSTIDSTTTNALTTHSHTHALGDVNISKILKSSAINYGALYNRYAVMDARKITSSDNYRVPSLTDFTDLLVYCGCDFGDDEIIDVPNNAYVYLQQSGTDKWDSSIAIGENQYNLNAVGSGGRTPDGAFNDANWTLKFSCNIWTTTDDNEGVDTWFIFFEGDQVSNSAAYLTAGFAARLVRDATLEEQSLDDGTYINDYTGNDLKQYRTVKIGSQVWLADNLCETKYRNGDWITGYDGGVYTPISDVAWAALTTEAMCFYDDLETNGMESVYLTSQHNDMDGLQGGDAENSEYYHLTAAEKANVENLATFATSYLSLTDTSDTAYTGKDLNVPVVNEATDELDLTETEIATFLVLSDTPSAYTGAANKLVSVKADESGLEFTTQVTLPVKASAAELNTGTDDAKFATAKGLKDAEFARIHVGTSPPSDTTMLWLDTN